MVFARTLLAICLLTSPRYLRASDVPSGPATDAAATDDVTAPDSETSSDDPTVDTTDTSGNEATAGDVTEPEPDTSSDDTTLDTEDTSNDEASTTETSSPEGDVTTDAENPADDASTGQTSGTTPEDAPNGDNISSGTAANYSNDGCIEATIPNILGIEACLKDSLNLCTGQNTLIEGVLLLVNCTVIGVFKNLTPMTALKTVKDVLLAILRKILPPVAEVLEAIPMLSLDGNIKDKTCRGPIKMGFPSSLGKCMDNTLKLCENGESVNESIITSLLSTLGCTLETVLTTTPNDLLSIVLCDIAKAMAAVFGNFFGTGDLISQLAAGTCPKS